jgi:uncharacterized protein involved in propanediol utilization
MTTRLQDLHQDFTGLQQFTKRVFIGEGAAYMDLVHQQIKPKKGFNEMIENSKEKTTAREDTTLEEGISGRICQHYTTHD